MLNMFTTTIFGENIYLLYDLKTKDAVIFDPGMKEQSLEMFVSKNNLNIRAILLTHGHGDHIMGVDEYLNMYGVELYANIKEKDILENPEYNYSKQIGSREVSFREVNYFKDGDILQFGSLEMKCLSTPGHTHGSTIFLTDDGAIVGDTIFKRSVGRYDLYSGNYDELKNSILNIVFKLDDDTVLYPGHGRSTTVAYEKRNNPFFKVR